MSLEVLARRDVDASEWDAAVRSARQRHFMFEAAYIDYHSDRFTDASLVITSKGKAVAAIPASIRDETVVSHGGLTFGGLLVTAALGAQHVVEALAAALNAWRELGATGVSVKPVPHIYHLAPAEEELFAWCLHGAVLESRHIAQAVMSGADVTWSNERARAVKRGRAAGVTMMRGDAFEEFMAMQRELLLRRHGVEPVHTATEMRLLADRFPDQIKLFEARADGELVAGVLVFETPRVAHAQYISASQRGQELRAQDALFAYLLEDVYREKPWFDFGISNERDGTLNAGLARNKEGFGARSVVYDRYALSL